MKLLDRVPRSSYHPFDMRNLKLDIAYDGTDFHGWQTQPGQRTVQCTLQDVLQHVVRHPVDLIASGRTDAGVHAAGQVVNFYTTTALAVQRLTCAIASRLPDDISVVRLRDVPLGFHATTRALSKLYRYRVHAARNKPLLFRTGRYVYHCHQPLDVERMARAARQFVGAHDFKAFTASRGPEKESYVRTVLRCDIYRDGQEVRIDVEGTGFLYNQVRNMVGTLIEIGRGHWAEDCIPRILASRERQNAGPTAPAPGLSLQWVRYPPDHALPEVEPACIRRRIEGMTGNETDRRPG